MDAKTFDMVDGILATKGFHEDRQAALDILEVGVREGTLVDVAKLIARRYALQPQVVIEWFGEHLNRRIKDSQEISNKLKEMTCCRIGYCVVKGSTYGGGWNKDLEEGRCPICKGKLGESNVGS